MQDQPNKLHLCSVFTRDLQRNRSSSISTGIKREVLLELSHKIKDEKSHDLFSANWRTSNAGGIIQHDFKGPCFPSGSDGKASACKAGDPGLIPGPGRSPGEGNGNLHQYSCLENPMDGGAIFLDQGLNMRPLQWQADSHPLYHRESPLLMF